METDAGVSGVGECCPIPSYLPAHADGVVAAATPLSEAILGQDPREMGRLEWAMDRKLHGHEYAKSPFDVALWDIAGKAAGVPVWMLLGGKLVEGVPMYRAAPQQELEATVTELDRLRAQGYAQFQIKVGAEWGADIERIRTTVPLLRPGETAFADANTGWTVSEAVRVARATEDPDYYLEQPCLTYEECLQVRQRTSLPMKLDECMTDLASVERAVADQAAEVICLKVSKNGGLTKTRRIRDYLVEHRIPMLVEDTWGGEIVTASLSHMAVSTPEELCVATTDLHNTSSSRAAPAGPPPPAADSSHRTPPAWASSPTTSRWVTQWGCLRSEGDARLGDREAAVRRARRVACPPPAKLSRASVR